MTTPRPPTRAEVALLVKIAMGETVAAGVSLDRLFALGLVRTIANKKERFKVELSHGVTLDGIALLRARGERAAVAAAELAGIVVDPMKATLTGRLSSAEPATQDLPRTPFGAALQRRFRGEVTFLDGSPLADLEWRLVGRP